MNRQAVWWLEDITHDTVMTRRRLLESLLNEVCACAECAGWTWTDDGGWPRIRWQNLKVVFRLPPEAQGDDVVLIGLTVDGQEEPRWTKVYIPGDTRDRVAFLASKVVGMCRAALQQSPES